MNFNLYIFGENQGVYNQYPDDYTSSTLSGLCHEAPKSTCVIIREQNLLHYIFAENFGNGNTLGICLIFNKVYVRHVHKIFSFLREIIESTLLKQSKIIRYGQNGEVEFTNRTLSDDTKAIEFIKTMINSRLDAENNYFGISELTSTYNGLKNCERVSFTATNSEINALLQKYNKLVIDSADEADQTLKIINGLRDNLSLAEDTVRQQKEQISKLEKTKKQYRKVVMLCFVLIGCCVGLYFLYAALGETQSNLALTESNLAQTQSELSDANETIEFQKETIREKIAEITDLNGELAMERGMREEAQERLNAILNSQSFIITGTSCSLANRRYTVRYDAADSGTKSLKIKVYDDGTGKLYTEKNISPYIYAGSGSFDVSFSKQFNPSDWYTFVILDDRTIVGGSRH